MDQIQNNNVINHNLNLIIIYNWDKLQKLDSNNIFNKNWKKGLEQKVMQLKK